MILLMFLLTVLIGGTGPAMVKFNVNNFHPLPLVFLRSALAAVFILPFIDLKKLTKEKPKKLLIISNILFALNWIFFAFGIKSTSVFIGQLTYVPTAILVAILEYFFLKVSLKVEQVFGLVLTLTGMGILLYRSFITQETLSFGNPFGNLLVIFGLLTWSIYTVISRKISNLYNPSTITFYNFLITFAIASILLLPQASKLDLTSQLSSKEALIGLFSLSLFSSVIFFYLYQWLIKNTSAFISSLVLYPITIFAAASGVVFYHEQLSLSLIISAVFVMIGVFVATSYQKIKKWTFQ